MSTRCQVQVIQEGLDWEQKVTLYHHWDGYPESMVQLIANAFDSNLGWILGRAGKVASLLCAQDPGGYDLESSNTLHGDIEYLYKLYCTNKTGGSSAENPGWELEILIPNWKKIRNFWENPIEKNMKVFKKRTNIFEMLKKNPEWRCNI